MASKEHLPNSVGRRMGLFAKAAVYVVIAYILTVIVWIALLVLMRNAAALLWMSKRSTDHGVVQLLYYYAVSQDVSFIKIFRKNDIT